MLTLCSCCCQLLLLLLWCAQVSSKPLCATAAAMHALYAGLFERLVRLDPGSASQLRTAFNQLPAVQACGYV